MVLKIGIVKEPILGILLDQIGAWFSIELAGPIWFSKTVHSFESIWESDYIALHCQNPYCIFPQFSHPLCK